MYVNPKVGIFITLNIEESNGEKKEIDKIIKDHFRPVICLIPDFEQICFTVLYSEGFLEAKVSKYCQCYKLLDCDCCLFICLFLLGFIEENIVIIQIM